MNACEYFWGHDSEKGDHEVCRYFGNFSRCHNAIRISDKVELGDGIRSYTCLTGGYISSQRKIEAMCEAINE